MIKRGLTLSLLSLSLLACGESQEQAQDTPQKPAVSTKPEGITRAQYIERATTHAQRMLKKVDGNGDALITRAEFDSWRQPVMERQKSNGLSEEAIAARADKVFSAFDKDGNGSISAEEFVQRQKDVAAWRFKKMDSNGDKVLSQEEQQAGRAG